MTIMVEKPTTGWSVDGSTRGNPGPSEYRCVDIDTGEIIFYVPIGMSTNNICEFLALGHAILVAVERNISIDIYSDSVTAISWILKKSVNSNLHLNKFTKLSLDYKDRVLAKIKGLAIKGDNNVLEINNKNGGGITVYKWLTSEWGECPADFDIK